MSNFKFNQPIEHIPSFKQWCIDSKGMSYYLDKLDIKTPMNLLDGLYYFTDLEGWGKILYDLVFHSSLYKTDRFDCENFALKAMNECAERYGLNTLAMIIGDIPQGRHGFNMLCFYDEGEVEFMLWEPNIGFAWSGEPFEIGEHGYKTDLALI